MIHTLYNQLQDAGLLDWAAAAILFLAAVAAALLLRWLCSVVVSRAVRVVARRLQYNWHEILLKKKVFRRAAGLAVPIFLRILAEELPDHRRVLVLAVELLGLFVVLRLFNAVVNAADEIYRLYPISKTRPIRGLLQILRVAFYAVGGVLLVAVLLDQSPLALLGGVGAATAVVTLIFKDAIMGFVAGVNLTASDMVHIGDRIEVPGTSADGIITDINMTTVKVENFNKSVTLLPAYTLMSQPFINWRNMQAAGGRRIKRAIHIDIAGIAFCHAPLPAHWEQIELLKDYLPQKQAALAACNAEQDMTCSANGRRLTNVGTFRAYVVAYLRQHPRIHHDLPVMVRQLDAQDRGLPLEVYAFTNTIDWAEYEDIQSDIFDHLYAVAETFGLRAYQRPSGGDVRAATRPAGQPPGPSARQSATE